MPRIVSTVGLSVVALALLTLGCNDTATTETQLVPLSWSTTLHDQCSSTAEIITVTQVLGPSGASIGNLTPGKYVARGTYTLAAAAQHVLTLTFYPTDEGYQTTQGNTVGEQTDYFVPSTSTTGSFEVVREILGGKANQPMVESYAGAQVSGLPDDCARVF
jgi:hypothetical protein